MGVSLKHCLAHRIWAVKSEKIQFFFRILIGERYIDWRYGTKNLTTFENLEIVRTGNVYLSFICLHDIKSGVW